MSAPPASSPTLTVRQRELRPQDWFVEVTAASGVDFAYHNGREGQTFTLLESVGGGAAIFDFDNDDLSDLFITGGGTIQGSPMVISGLTGVFYRNLGHAHFIDVANRAGIGGASFYTVGCSACDFNCDGLSDLFLTGYPDCRLYCNQGDGTFLNVTKSAELFLDGLHTASTWGDFDNDGAPDLLVVHQNAPVSILNNSLPHANWVRLCLRGTKSDPFAVCAVVTAKFAGRNLVRHIRSGSGYLSHFDRRVLLPVDSDVHAECSVQWLHGKCEIFRNLHPNQTNQLIEGRGEAL
jgi:hypothetical protein